MRDRSPWAGNTSMLVNVGPILIALLSGLLLGEGFPRWLVVGAGIAFTGAVLIGWATSGSAGADPLGVLLSLLAAAACAAGVLSQKPFLRRLPALQVTFTACVIGAVTCLSPRRWWGSCTPPPAGPSPAWCTSGWRRPPSPSRPGRTRCPGWTPAAWV